MSVAGATAPTWRDIGSEILLWKLGPHCSDANSFLVKTAVVGTVIGSTLIKVKLVVLGWILIIPAYYATGFLSARLCYEHVFLPLNVFLSDYIDSDTLRLICRISCLYSAACFGSLLGFIPYLHLLQFLKIM